MIVCFVGLWMLCSFLAYGLSLGNLTHNFPYFSHCPEVAVLSLFGPFSLVSVLIVFNDPYMWRLRPLTEEQRWGEHQKAFPNLGRAFFK